MPSDEEKTRRIAAVLVVLFLLGWGAYWALVKSSPKREATGGPFPDKKGGGLARGAPEMPAPKPRKPSAAAGPEKAVELDELLQLLADAGEQPVARKFGEEFKADPKLSRTFEDFREDQKSEEPKQSLEGFARKLGDMAEFRRLTARFAGEPGFKEAALVFLKVPKLTAVAREQIAHMKTALRSRSRQTLASSRRGGAGGAPGTAGRPGGAAGTLASHGALAGPGGGSGGGGEAIRAQSASSHASSDAGGGAGEHAVGGLSDIGGVDNIKNASNPFASLCYKKDPAITQQQCAAIEEHLGDYDIWEACIRADLYEKCRNLCKSKPALNCGPIPNLYDKCLTANLPESKCLADCNAIAPVCTPPPPPAPPPTATTPGASGPGPETAGGSCTPRTFTKVVKTECKGGKLFIWTATCDIVCPGGGESCGAGRITSCFPAGTRIETPAGPRAIESLGVGEPVFAVDPRTGELLSSTVAGKRRSTGERLLTATLSDGRKLRATREHPFWDPDAGEYRPLGSWRAGQRMLGRRRTDAAFSAATVDSLVEEPGEHEVFNVSIDHPNHNYVADGFVVHNKFICP